MDTIGNKIKQVFPKATIMKSTDRDSIFAGRNLPSFVKDFILRKHIQEDGTFNKQAITEYLSKHIPDKDNPVINRLMNNEEVKLLTRFVIQSDIKDGKVRFSIPDSGIKANDAVIRENLLSKYKKELVDGEIWGVITLYYIRPSGKVKNGCVEMVDFMPFRPYTPDLNIVREGRKQFTIEEWIDVLISSMEYSPEGFTDTEQKLEFLTRLLVFVESNLNMIELAPKEMGKSYIFGNLSKYGWLVSDGKITRAKLFYDKVHQEAGIFNNHDFVAFDEIQSLSLSDQRELQSIFRAYLEQGKASVGNYTFTSTAGLMLMGNIELTNKMLPVNDKYFSELPSSFYNSGMLDRFHGFIEGWKLPKLKKDMLLNGWTLNVEYFSELLHLLRTAPEYSLLFDNVIDFDAKTRLRDSKAIKKMATAYLKLLFPHITKAEDLNKDEFLHYCLEPAIRRRSIIREQCSKIDAEFEVEIPRIRIR